MIAIVFLLAVNTAAPRKAPPLCSDYIHHVQNFQGHGRSLPLKVSGRVQARLRNARRDELGLESNAIAKAVKQIDSALDLIAKTDLRAYPPDDVASMTDAIRKYRDCLKKAPPVERAKIRVVVSRYTSSGGTVPFKGANVLLELKHAGITGNDGSLTLAVAADRKLQVNADDGRHFAGSADVTVPAGATKRVAITLAEIAEGHVAEPDELTLDEVRDDGILPYDFPTFTLRFIDDDEKTVPIKGLGEVSLWIGGTYVEQLDAAMFAVTPSGRIVAANPELVRRVLLKYPGTLSLSVAAYDRKDREYENDVRFEVGRNRLSGYLIPMPPAPKVDIGNAYIVMSNQAGTVYRRRADERGQFDFSYIPSGIVHFTATCIVGDVEYKARADIHMDGDMRDVILSMDRQAK